MTTEDSHGGVESRPPSAPIVETIRDDSPSSKQHKTGPLRFKAPWKWPWGKPKEGPSGEQRVAQLVVSCVESGNYEALGELLANASEAVKAAVKKGDSKDMFTNPLIRFVLDAANHKDGASPNRRGTHQRGRFSQAMRDMFAFGVVRPPKQKAPKQ